MKNIAKKTVLVLTIAVLSVMQASASTVDTNKETAWTNFLSFFKHKASIDYVAEDNLLENYMLGSTQTELADAADISESLLSNYMFGKQESETVADKIVEERVLAKYMMGETEASEKIALSEEIPVAYAADFDDEQESNVLDYVIEDIISEKY